MIDILTCTSYITQLTSKGISGTILTSNSDRSCHFRSGFPLFVFLSFQVFPICLGSSTTDFTNVTIMQLLWFRGRFGPQIFGTNALLVTLPPARSLLLSGGSCATLLSDVHRCRRVKGGVVPWIRGCGICFYKINETLNWYSLRENLLQFSN